MRSSAYFNPLYRDFLSPYGIITKYLKSLDMCFLGYSTKEELRYPYIAFSYPLYTDFLSIDTIYTKYLKSLTLLFLTTMAAG